jgi:hypothetical protein
MTKSTLIVPADNHKARDFITQFLIMSVISLALTAVFLS